MGATQQALLMVSGAVANVGGNNALNARFDTTGTTASTSFVNVVSPSGGAAVTTSITKATGTSGVLVCASIGAAVGATETLVLGVNDGTTDWTLGFFRANTTSDGRVFGTRVLTGLSAGAYTFTLRFRSLAGGTIGTGSTDSLFLFTMEVEV